MEKLQYWLAASEKRTKQKVWYGRYGYLHTSHLYGHQFSFVVLKTDLISQLPILWSWSQTLKYWKISEKHGDWSYHAVFIKHNKNKDVIMNISIVLHLFFGGHDFATTPAAFTSMPLCVLKLKQLPSARGWVRLMKTLGLLSITTTSFLMESHSCKTQNLFWKIYTS